ncbi:hypothetical protein [Noviherbaspirillum sedimenti]|uniref:Uncharacterized protein n=1 Tax=Noviherbaspirillum sedimenti TaxID=2320865 RepID=A0A3A3FZZ5_9BURK|nr:hypothetical protein [Noviherbaspirillum sedimenti]RJG00965.1 hypothetical protein D3878_04655 [Noviherbaspirillum sedimenti]
MNTFNKLIILVWCALGVYWLWRWLAGRRPSSKRFPKVDTYRGYLSRLTLACFGDRAAANRLILYEKRLDRSITLQEAGKRAYERLERDRSGGLS